MDARAAWLTALAGTLVAIFGGVGVAISDPPHLSFEALDPWLVVYALGLCVALGAAPFVLHSRFAARIEDRDSRWEQALTAWGGLALAALAAFIVSGLALGFDPDSASGAIAIVGVVASGLILGGLFLLVVSS